MDQVKVCHFSIDITLYKCSTVQNYYRVDRGIEAKVWNILNKITASFLWKFESRPRIVFGLNDHLTIRHYNSSSISENTFRQI